MSFGSIGFSEMLVIAVLVLVFFGPRRMPEIGRAVGGAMREFRRGLNEIQRELQEAERSASVEPEKQRGASAPPPSSSFPTSPAPAVPQSPSVVPQPPEPDSPEASSSAPSGSDSEAKPNAMGD
ncbi:MAG: twin-arginine translocase TatA/TatE family subunit [Gemmatimonadetes bacterium]|nr:twin-arginine translocase TatA/TatE family subunit [Gemmatimonadota bacterium]